MSSLAVMLSFHDEDPRDLTDCIWSLASLKPELLIAVEGPYEFYNAPRRFSLVQQWTSILSAAAFSEVHSFNESDWFGNEVEKRQFMLDEALQLTNSKDWLMVVDADYRLHRCPVGWRSELDNTDFDAVEIGFFEGQDGQGIPGTYPMRMFMRAEQLRMGGNHYHYIRSDGAKHHILGERDATIPALDATNEVLVEHLVRKRPPERRQAQTTYYDLRDHNGIEKT